MIKWLIKSTNEIRVETEEDANRLHKQMEQFAHDNEYILNTWTQTLKTQKSKGEILAEWYVCRYTLVFNDAKEPTNLLTDIDYIFDKGGFIDGN
jgi:hypothetical protein